MNGYDHWLTQGSEQTHTRDDLEREAEARADEDFHRLSIDAAVCGEDPPSYEGCLWHARRNMGLEE